LLVSHPLDRFCSVRSQAQHDLEPLVGTAMQATSYVFLSWPKVHWARRQFESRNFPGDLAVFLGRLQKERKIFTRLFKPERQVSAGKCDVMIMGDTQVIYTEVSVDAVAPLLETHFDGHPGGEPIRDLTLFCCTHGKRDLCCAKFGLAVVHAFRQTADKLSIPANIFECTHIGADRFAATAVSFPHRFMFGRLRSDNVPLVLSNLVRGQPFIPCYRGRLGMNSLEQIGEAVGYQYLSTRRLPEGEIRVQSSELSRDTATVDVLVLSETNPREHRIRVSCVQREFTTYMDCDGVRANQTRRVRRWVLAADTLP